MGDWISPKCYHDPATENPRYRSVGRNFSSSLLEEYELMITTTTLCFLLVPVDHHCQKKATTVSVMWDEDQELTHNNSWWGVSNYDTMLIAFRRDSVPFVFPHATLEPGASEHISQATILWWCFMMTCAPPSSLVFVPKIWVSRIPCTANINDKA